MANTSVQPTRALAGAAVMTGFPFYAFAITTSDTNIFVDAGATSVAVPVSVYVGVSGNVKVTPFSSAAADATTVTFTNFPAGEMLPVQVQKVWATGTTATGLIGVC